MPPPYGLDYMDSFRRSWLGGNEPAIERRLLCGFFSCNAPVPPPPPITRALLRMSPCLDERTFRGPCPPDIRPPAPAALLITFIDDGGGLGVD